MDKYKSINNKKSRKKIKDIYNKVYNKITDLHWKSINYLIKTEHIGCILIGNMSTKDISINNTKNYLLPIYKRLASSVRYYSFLQKLKFKCEEYNIEYYITDESFTSKICCKCASLCKINKQTRCLDCKCKTNLDRDLNGCINILLKNL
jgi:putative transposase